jgi:hypothetical protein
MNNAGGVGELAVLPHDERLEREPSAVLKWRRLAPFHVRRRSGGCRGFGFGTGHIMPGLEGQSVHFPRDLLEGRTDDIVVVVRQPLGEDLIGDPKTEGTPVNRQGHDAGNPAVVRVFVEKPPEPLGGSPPGCLNHTVHREIRLIGVQNRNLWWRMSYVFSVHRLVLASQRPHPYRVVAIY